MRKKLSLLLPYKQIWPVSDDSFHPRRRFGGIIDRPYLHLFPMRMHIPDKMAGGEKTEYIEVLPISIHYAV